ncbi:MAG: hypothetical protein IPI77_20195 [Saprospiraceae bacterium]|nr:hypothetical protein [Saprospiraceae bacterium]
MKSVSHKSSFIGILDMNGNKIFNNSELYVHDRTERDMYKMNSRGKVAWCKGSYIVSGGNCNGYNIYAWRKKIEVLNVRTKPIFIREDFESSWQTFSRTLGITEPSRKEIKRAFKYAYEAKIENNLK